jgi:hypothetical protein
MKGLMDKVLFVFAITAGFGLALNMAAIPLNPHEIFWNRDTLAPIEAVILIGFAAVLLFDILVLAWAGTRLFSGRGGPWHRMVLALSAIGLVLLAGDKVLLDEIAREQRLGTAGGEWLVLYLCFAGQLALNLLILFRFLPRFRRSGSASRTAPLSD